MAKKQIPPKDFIMKISPSNLIIFALVVSCNIQIQAADFPPQDHAGADLVLQDGDVVWGIHENIGQFSIPANATVFVSPYDGNSSGSRGMVEINAFDIEIAGSLNAQGAGYSGGGGGGGGGFTGFGGSLGGSFIVTAGGEGGAGAYDLSLVKGKDGERPEFVCCLFTYEPGVGGAGAPGDGPFGGLSIDISDSFEGNYTPLDPGNASLFNYGGYAGPRENQDNSIDDSTNMGSGGAGLFGYPSSASNSESNGGKAGGNGGGSIRLIAANNFILAHNASIRADGALGNDGEPKGFLSGANVGGGDGGNAVPPVLSGGPGSPGAGGGILIKLKANGTGLIASGSVITSMGGRDINESISINGGTIKIFSEGTLTIDENSDLRASRMILPGLPIPPAPELFNKPPEGGYVEVERSVTLVARLTNNIVDDNSITTYLYKWESNNGETVAEKIIPFKKPDDYEPQTILMLSEFSDGVSLDPGEIWTLTVTPIDFTRLKGTPLSISFLIESDTCYSAIGEGSSGVLGQNVFAIY